MFFISVILPEGESLSAPTPAERLMKKSELCGGSLSDARPALGLLAGYEERFCINTIYD